MEEQVRNNIRESYTMALETKLAFLSSALESVQKRNDELKRLPSIQKTEFSENTEEVPDQDTLRTYFESKADLEKSKRKYENLNKASQQLDERIKKAHKLLKAEREKYNFRYVEMLSPTAAKILNPDLANSRNQTKQQLQGQTLEIAYLKRQLQAIEDLKNGAVPKPRGTIDINFDELIENEKRNLNRILADKEKNKKIFIDHIESRMAESNSLQNSIQSHTKYAASFANFQKMYNTLTDSTEALPFRSLKTIFKEESQKKTRECLEEALDSLQKEKEMIVNRLEKMGVDDEESVNMKHEIQVKLLYLGHVTASAEKGLCKLRTLKQPIDPLETIKIENSEMELEN